MMHERGNPLARGTGIFEINVPTVIKIIKHPLDVQKCLENGQFDVHPERVEGCERCTASVPA